jgi:hypothetical protein
LGVTTIAQRVAHRYAAQERIAYRFARKTLNLAEYNLQGLLEHRSVTLYHGTTRLFHTFKIDKSRKELVDRFYGDGIFLTPSKRVAVKYAEANRNIGFEKEMILADMKKKNPRAGEFLQRLVDEGTDAWNNYPKEVGFINDNPPPGQGTFDSVGFQNWLKVDPNTLNDIAGYIIGSKITPLGMDDASLSLFSTSTGAPDYLYNYLDEVGLDSKSYRPKVYTVSVLVHNTLVTSSKAQAKGARSKGYDCVVYYGSDLVDGVPEVAVFKPSDVKVKHIEVV